MRAKEGEFIKITDINGNIEYGKFYYNEDRTEIEVIILKSDDIYRKDLPKQTNLKLNELGDAVDKDGFRLLIEELDNRLLKEELRQLYNMFAG
ncbi:hypothetical protein [Clostridium cellulovorans]|uniref:Uncharacterized protein n=1 Tax=Clostridium cellulovorans (strain ATCC 35296 / DSM 3052 / OCM 3 / 743B) TaxID=573061 RepID=D9SNQ2_CLOC7|nr:hypothetical protein [Clostridium cellulovorans]ADL49923.1 hypothetical protein Clocel_0134 [Clostridium cellulovorans 743B]